MRFLLVTYGQKVVNKLYKRVNFTDFLRAIFCLRYMLMSYVHLVYILYPEIALVSEERK